VVLDSETVTTQAAANCQADNSAYPQSEEVCATSAPQPPSAENNWSDPLVANGKLIGIGNVLTDPANSDRAFERMSVFHNLITADLGRTPPGNEDWGGDGNSDLLGVNSATGHLTYFEGFGANPATNPGFIGQFDISDMNWSNGYRKLLRVDNWSGDGKEGLLAVTAGGDLKYYPVDGSGHRTNAGGQTIGSGFRGMPSVLSVGSFGGTDTGSLMTVDWNGYLKVYSANGTGGWINGNGTLIGTGFSSMRSVF
jgi:hypothetical protein